MSENEQNGFVYTSYTYQNVPIILYENDQYITWKEANSYCSILLGTQLATMNNGITYNGMLKLMDNNNKNGFVFTGLIDDNNDNIYTWLSDNSIFDDTLGYGWSDLTSIGGNCTYFYNPISAGINFYGMLDIPCYSWAHQTKYFACDLPNIHEYINKYIGVYIYNNTKNMYDANEYCNNTFGTELATILTNEQNTLAYNSVNNIKNNNINFIITKAWIGINNITNFDEFDWQDGRDSNTSGFTNWYVFLICIYVCLI